MLCNLNRNLPPVSTIAGTQKRPAQSPEVRALGHCGDLHLIFSSVPSNLIFEIHFLPKSHRLQSYQNDSQLTD